jgi:hypothetical protein
MVWLFPGCKCPSRNWNEQRPSPEALRTSEVTRRVVARWGCAVCLVVLWSAWACKPPPSEPVASTAAGIQLRDATADSGITFVHTDGSSGRRYIVETVTTGLAVFDYDGDGWNDVYFLNGRPLPGAQAEKPPRNALYKNLGGFKFAEVTDSAHVGDAGYGMGVAVADYDNDGDADIYVSNFGPKVLYRNNGDGTFTDVTKQAGVADGNKVGAGVVFLDIDGDGDLDLYVANYVKFSFETHVPRFREGYPEYAGPKDYPAEPHTLFRNNGDGTFTDISRESGIAEHPGTGMGVVAADYDNDGRPDIFALNDVSRNFFWRNDGSGRFEEVAVSIGAAYNVYGDSLGSMGVDCGDYDNDGWLDFFQTSYEGELPVLFRNLGGGLLEDVTLKTGAGVGSLPHVKWGCAFADLDNDGHKDIFYVCGHLQDNIELYRDNTFYQAAPILLRNTGDGKFVNVSETAGDGMRVKGVGRGAAIDDLDNDGRLDVVILNSRGRPTILRNLSETGNHWIRIRLQGVKTNRDGVGARVKVVAADLTQIDEVHSGRGYQSHFGTTIHFGLGRRERVDRIEVRWIGGGTDLWENVPVDQTLTIFEGNETRGRVFP